MGEIEGQRRSDVPLSAEDPRMEARRMQEEREEVGGRGGADMDDLQIIEHYNQVPLKKEKKQAGPLENEMEDEDIVEIPQVREHRKESTPSRQQRIRMENTMNKTSGKYNIYPQNVLLRDEWIY